MVWNKGSAGDFLISTVICAVMWLTFPTKTVLVILKVLLLRNMSVSSLFVLSFLDVAHSPASAVVSHPRLRGMSGSESSDTRTTAAITLPTLHLPNKMVAGSVALAAEAARLPGGAELNILPANGAVRATTSGKHHPITLSGGLCCLQNNTCASEVTFLLLRFYGWCLMHKISFHGSNSKAV